MEPEANHRGLGLAPRQAPFRRGRKRAPAAAGTVVKAGMQEILAQGRKIMQILQTVLHGTGSSLERAVMVRIYLVNFAADYPAVNAAYASYFKPGRFPARTTVGVTNMVLGSLVEIDLIVRC